MSYPVHTAIEAEVAYRRERLLDHFRPVHRVGTVREARRSARSQGRSAAAATGPNPTAVRTGADR
jgi:hypothetical protein